MKVRILVSLAGILCLASSASAIPTLQLYIEGATYDTGSETWVLSTVSDPIRLWVIGYGQTASDPILDVKLAVAYSSASTPTIAIDGSKTGGYGGFTDPSTSADPTLLGTHVGGAPTLYGGGSLAPHGIYGPATGWQEFSLGDFDLVDSPTGDFITSLPSPQSNKMGQINVYEFSVSGLTGGLHFDAYNHFEGANHAEFAPFSHDAGAVPAPGAVLLGVIGLGLVSWAKRWIS